MSLISPRNLLAPLQNKVHLFTIVLIAVAFLVLRLSGGTVAVHEKDQPAHLRGQTGEQVRDEGQADSRGTAPSDLNGMFDPRKEAERLGLPPAQEKKLPETASVSPRDKSLINEMLRNSDRKKAVTPAVGGERQPEPKKGENALDEIEHSLGLR